MISTIVMSVQCALATSLTKCVRNVQLCFFGGGKKSSKTVCTLMFVTVFLRYEKCYVLL